MRKLVVVTVVAGGVALAVVVGQRMSTDAMAVVIGVVFGVAASIPTSLLVVAATRGRRDERVAQREQGMVPPQIYIVGSGMGTQQRAPWQGGQGLLPPGAPGINGGHWPYPPASYWQDQPSRRYRVVGEDERWLDASEWE